MQIACGAHTDVGLRRAHNEDSLCADPDLGLFVVCDGMGGHRAGEVASRLAVQVIQKHLRESSANALRPIVGDYDPAFSPDRKSTRLNSSHSQISYAVFCLKKKNACR